MGLCLRRLVLQYPWRGGRVQPESVAAFNRNQWQPSPGIGGRFRPESVATFARNTHFLAQLRQHAWVVYAKPPFASAQQVVSYLGRYTHRVAISNHRLVAVHEGQVAFRWPDYRHGNRVKVMTLAAGEFLRGFLLHTLPRGWVRVPHSCLP